MKPWQLSVALMCGRVRHVEVLTLRCCGYQVRVVSFANKANLSWQDAEQPLHQGLLRSLAGIF